MPSLKILDKHTLFSIGQEHAAARKSIMGDGAMPRLKGFQDAIAFEQTVEIFRHHKGVPFRVADVGGDQSRILRMLSERLPEMTGAIIDTWEESIGNGTTKRPDALDGVVLFDTLLGKATSKDIIDNDSFDVVLSISVVEHIPTEELEAFFTDSLRICKPGGVILHYIDQHLSDAASCVRAEATAVALERAWGTLEERPSSWAFKSNYVSNPDSMMFRWGERANNMDRRARQQAVCLVARYDVPIQKSGPLRHE